MRKAALYGFGVVAAVLSGCTIRPDTGSSGIVVLDNIGGGARPVVQLESDDLARIEVENHAGDCSLREFWVAPGRSAQPPEGNGRVELADSTQGEKAILHLRTAPGGLRVTARYVHTVLVDEGSRAEPEKEVEASGSGQMHVGRLLSNGYRFDHYDFSRQTVGPGGASARVTEASLAGSDRAYLEIHWDYDRYSKVSFSWKTYAIGPCNFSP